jgi:hypothetical protein
MKKLKLSYVVLALTAGMAFNANAVSYTNTGGYSNTVSKSNTQTHNVTVREGVQKIKTTDISHGGLDNTTGCDPINCNGSDNITKGETFKTINTNLTVVNTGESVRNSTTASCFSGSNMNGLAHSESRSVENFTSSGWSNIEASGNIISKTINKTTTTNGGLEVGSSFDKVIDTTLISELTKTTFTTKGQNITFSSSVGE